MARGRAHVMRGESAGIGWELAQRPPSVELRPFIRELQGYTERSAAPVVRREFAAAQIVVILEFEPRLRVFLGGQERHFTVFRDGFVRGWMSVRP